MTTASLQPRMLLLSVLAALGCDSTAPREVSFDGTWAGHSWRGDAHAIIDAADTLHITGSSPAGSVVPRTYVRIAVPFNGTGTYVLPVGAAEFNYLIGGDVLSARYASTSSGTATLVIEHVTDDEVSGSARFDAVAVGAEQPVGATARFEGRFKAQRLRWPVTAGH